MFCSSFHCEKDSWPIATWGFLSNRPPNHPFIDGISRYKPSSYWGTPFFGNAWGLLKWCIPLLWLWRCLVTGLALWRCEQRWKRTRGAREGRMDTRGDASNQNWSWMDRIQGYPWSTWHEVHSMWVLNTFAVGGNTINIVNYPSIIYISTISHKDQSGHHKWIQT